MQPNLGTTPASRDALDDDDSEEAITDDNENNIINIADKCNGIFQFHHLILHFARVFFFISLAFSPHSARFNLYFIAKLRLVKMIYKNSQVILRHNMKFFIKFNFLFSFIVQQPININQI